MTVFRIGQGVRIKKLARNGIVSDILGGGRLKVALGSLTLTCRETELQPLQKEPSRASPHKPWSSPVRAAKTAPLDLHGMTVVEALRAVDAWLDTLILTGAESGTIIHGLGSGKLRDAVHRHLPTLTVVKHFALNELNAGETKVFL